jgi:hypothetical protein
MTQIGVQPDTSSSTNSRSGVHQILETLFRAAQEQGDVRTGLAPTELAWMFEFLCMGAVMVWLHLPDDSLEQRFLLALDVLLDGVASPASPDHADNSA